MTHPDVIRPAALAEWRADKMGKSTIFESPRLLVGLNAFEPGQAHALHAHHGMGGQRLHLDRIRLDLRKAEVAMPARDDTLEVAGKVWKVQAAPTLDVEGLVWSMDCYPA